MLELPDLTQSQFNLVYNLSSMTIAVMGAAFIYIIVSRRYVARRFEPALLISAIVVAVAAYHYFRINNNLQAAYELADGMFVPTGEPYNSGYRYVDWLITVPLLLAELVAVLSLRRESARPLLIKLAGAAALMIILGYPGEVAAVDATVTRLVWGALSTIPFAYLLYVIFVELGGALAEQPNDIVRTKIRNLRLLLVATWGVYPIAYLLPVFSTDPSPVLFVGREVGYSIADMLAKAAFGALVVGLAKRKSDALSDEERRLDAEERVASAF